MSSFDKSINLICKNMKNTTLKFEDFQSEKLSRTQQKTVKGGDDPTEPSNQTGKGATRP